MCYKRFLFKRVHTRQIDKLELLSWQFAAAAKEFCWTLVENNRILLFCMKNTVKQTAKAATIVVAKYSKVWEEAAQDTSAPCQRCRTKGSPDRTPCRSKPKFKGTPSSRSLCASQHSCKWRREAAWAGYKLQKLCWPPGARGQPPPASPLKSTLQGHCRKDFMTAPKPVQPAATPPAQGD